MQTIEEFAEGTVPLRHHAVLLVGSKLPQNGLSWEHMAQIAKHYCQIDISAPGENEFWQIFAGHPDVAMVPKDEQKIKLEHVALLREQTFYRASFGSRKLVFIDRCERLSSNSANALLKTLEEPPAPTLFLLTAVNLRNVLPTISSRCQRIPTVFSQNTPPCPLMQIESEDRQALEQLFQTLCSRLLKAAAGVCQMPNTNSHPNPAQPIVPNFFSHGYELCGFDLSIDAKTLKLYVNLAESLAKRYQAADLIEALAVLFSRLAKAGSLPAGLLRDLTNLLRTWKSLQPYNPSAFFWLVKIFMSGQIVPKNACFR